MLRWFHPHRRSGLALGAGFAGLVATLLGIWGGIIPFIGPSFAYSADGSTAWNMTSAHLWLAVIPGAIAFACGLLISVEVPRSVAGAGRGVSMLGGVGALLSGAWFVIGAVAWPVVTSASHYYLPATPLRELGYQVGYGLGPGILIILAGAFALGWAVRHQTWGAKRVRRADKGCTAPL